MTVISKALLDDHDRIKRLFAAFNRSPSTFSAMNILEELKLHSTIEEELVYPVLRETSAGLADQAENDHADLSDLIAEIESRDPSDPMTMKLMRQLETDLMAHIAMEEKNIFPQLKQRPGLDPLDLGREHFAMRQEMLADRDPMRSDSRGLANTGWGGSSNNAGWGGNAGW
ncbi:MAG: hemerythrin domain-containing protein [Actinomycetota bacterium]|nr:hemerythrin domain-containing protein [Actinomycetota bacterium]